MNDEKNNKTDSDDEKVKNFVNLLELMSVISNKHEENDMVAMNLAVVIRNQYQAFIKVGFTPAESLDLIKTIIANLGSSINK